MKYILITVTILFCLNPVFSQKDTSQFYNKTLSKNNFCIELGGKAILYSVGYERVVYRSKKILLTGGVNLSTDLDLLVVPIGLNLLYGVKENKLLFGLYATNFFDFSPYPKTKKEREEYRNSGQYKYDYYSPPYKLAYIFPSVGYRRYFKKGNSLSLAFTTPIDLNETYEFYPWFSINYNFKL